MKCWERGRCHDSVVAEHLSHHDLGDPHNYPLAHPVALVKFHGCRAPPTLCCTKHKTSKKWNQATKVLSRGLVLSMSSGPKVGHHISFL
eukprot:1574199-Amphidinium_carterae.1